MFKQLMELLYNKGLATNNLSSLQRRAKMTFLFLEIACNYIPEEFKAQALDEMVAMLEDQIEDWDTAAAIKGEY